MLKVLFFHKSNFINNRLSCGTQLKFMVKVKHHLLKNYYLPRNKNLSELILFGSFSFKSPILEHFFLNSKWDFHMGWVCWLKSWWAMHLSIPSQSLFSAFSGGTSTFPLCFLILVQTQSFVICLLTKHVCLAVLCMFSNSPSHHNLRGSKSLFSVKLNGQGFRIDVMSFAMSHTAWVPEPCLGQQGDEERTHFDMYAHAQAMKLGFS